MCEKTDKAVSLMKILDIPHLAINDYSDAKSKYHNTSTVRLNDLYDILMDEKKLKTIVSKLKMKAFW